MITDNNTERELSTEPFGMVVPKYEYERELNLKIPNESMTLKNSILLCLIIGIVLYINCLTTEYNLIKNIKLFSFIHDNTMVFIPLSFYIYYLIINKIKEST